MTEGEKRDPESRLDARVRLATLIVAAVAALLLMRVALADRQTKFDELALGEAVSLFAEHDGHPIHVMFLDDVERLVAAAREREASKRVLWLGNSQLHAINGLQEGDKTASWILFDELRPRGVDVVTVSFPNANLQEHYVAFEFIRQRLEGLDALVLPVVFDDLRESGLRADVAKGIADARVKAALEGTAIGRTLIEETAATAVDDEQAVDLGGVRGTVQERTERALNTWLADHWILWRLRPEARGQFFTLLYQARNEVFRIKANTKRPLKEATYQRNLEALRALLDAATALDIHVLVYNVPLRSDVETPYVASEYARFLDDCRTITDRPGVSFVDLGGLVPGELWGSRGKGLGGVEHLDFMHFRGGGHALLAQAIARELEPVVQRHAGGNR